MRAGAVESVGDVEGDDVAERERRLAAGLRVVEEQRPEGASAVIGREATLVEHDVAVVAGASAAKRRNVPLYGLRRRSTAASTVLV